MFRSLMLLALTLSLVCAASQAKTGGVPNFESTRAWLGKICGSMKSK